MTSRATEFRIALLAFGLLAVLFVAFPQIDLAASSLFYRGDGEWALHRTSPWLFLPYHGLPRIEIAAAPERVLVVAGDVTVPADLQRLALHFGHKAVRTGRDRFAHLADGARLVEDGKEDVLRDAVDVRNTLQHPFYLGFPILLLPLKPNGRIWIWY